MSRTSAVQPCAFASSPVCSYSLRLSQPTTPGPATPELVHSVWSASRAKLRWWVGKQVLISVHLPVFGSYIERWRFASPASGNAFADGCSAPLHQSGFLFGRTREVNHTRPFSSIIGLWLSVRLFQIGLGPHTADGPNGLSFDEGVSGSRTGWNTSSALFLPGSSTGT